MSVWKGSILLFVVFTLLVLSAVPASAVTITDDTDDVMYGEYGDEEYGGAVVSRPNIDIKSVSYTITGSEITLTMTVKGTIEDSDLIGYFICYGMVNETDKSVQNCYMASYGNGLGSYGYFISGISGGLLPIDGGNFQVHNFPDD